MWIQISDRFGTIEDIKEERPPLAAGAEIEANSYHFATADEADDRNFKRQYQFFQRGIGCSLKPLPTIVHASNSATSCGMRITDFHGCALGRCQVRGLNPKVLVLSSAS